MCVPNLCLSVGQKSLCADSLYFSHTRDSVRRKAPQTGAKKKAVFFLLSFVQKITSVNPLWFSFALNNNDRKKKQQQVYVFTTAYVVIPCAFLFTYTATLFFFFSFLCVSVGFYRFTSLGSLTTCFIAISNPLSPPLPPKKKNSLFFFFVSVLVPVLLRRTAILSLFSPVTYLVERNDRGFALFFFFVCVCFCGTLELKKKKRKTGLWGDPVRIERKKNKR